MQRNPPPRNLPQRKLSQNHCKAIHCHTIHRNFFVIHLSFNVPSPILSTPSLQLDTMVCNEDTIFTWCTNLERDREWIYSVWNSRRPLRTIRTRRSVTLAIPSASTTTTIVQFWGYHRCPSDDEQDRQLEQKHWRQHQQEEQPPQQFLFSAVLSVSPGYSTIHPWFATTVSQTATPIGRLSAFSSFLYSLQIRHKPKK